MSLKLRVVKKEMKQGGASKVKNYTPPRFLWRDANNYPELSIVNGTFDMIPRNVRKPSPDIDFVGVIKSEFPNRKKPKGNSKGVGPSYKVTIKFQKIKMSKEPTRENTERLEDKGETFYYKMPSLAKNPAKIRCQCVDFRHKFETPIARAGALAYGSPRGYKRKTEEPTDANMLKWEAGELEKKPMPYANPTDKLGYCKHIHSFLAYLIDDAKMVKQS